MNPHRIPTLTGDRVTPGDTPLYTFHAGARVGGNVQDRVSPGVTLSPSDLIDLASRITRLSLDHRDPESFHVEKHSIASSLRRLAKGGKP